MIPSQITNSTNLDSKLIPCHDCDDHHKDQSNSPLSPDPSNSCTCTLSNLQRIDNYPKGLHIDIHRGLFSSHNKLDHSRDNWYQQLLTNVRWHRVKYKSNRFQKDCETPCWTTFYGGRSEYKPYTPVPSWLQPLIDQVTSHLGSGITFNAFLLRLYFDGKDEIAWHTDGRTFLGEEPTIASLSLGYKATFQLRRMNDVWPCADGSKSTEGCVDMNMPIESFVLDDGDLLVMRGKTQKHWHHRVPKEKGRGVRLNINFRYVMPGLDAERGQMTYYKYMVYGDCPIDKQPPSWTFDEIMTKRGGMMNFIQRGIKRKVECQEQPTEELAKEVSQSKDGSKCEASFRPQALNNNCDGKTSESGNIIDNDAQQYLASELSVDKEVFMSLPVEIQSEIVSQWKTQQLNQSNAIFIAANTNKNQRNSTSNNSGNNPKKKGTLDSFFGKK